MKIYTNTESRAARLEAIAAKRKKQAAPNDSDSSSEAMEENEFEDAPGIRIKGAAKRRQSGKQQFTRPIRHAPTSSAQLQLDSSSEEVALAKVKVAARPVSSNSPAVQQPKHTDLPAKAARPLLSASKRSGAVPSRAARGGKGAMRGGSNVFQSRDQTKGERSVSLLF